jgi:hypothetical protein
VPQNLDKTIVQLTEDEVITGPQGTNEGIGKGARAGSSF